MIQLESDVVRRFLFFSVFLPIFVGGLFFSSYTVDTFGDFDSFDIDDV